MGWRRPGRSMRRRRGLLDMTCDWEREEERAPHANFAAHPQPAAVGFDDALRDEQAEADTVAAVSSARPVAIEQVGDLLLGDARPRVGHGKTDLVPLGPGANRDRSLCGHELDRV